MTQERERTEAPAETEAPRQSAPRGDGEGGGERPRRRFGRRRVCLMCVEKMKVVDYKNVNLLRRYISERGRIDTRRKSNCCAKHQRALAMAIKRARHLALLPYTTEHIRTSGLGHAR